MRLVHGVAVHHPHDLTQRQDTRRCSSLLDRVSRERVEKRAGAPIQDRRLRGIEIDDEIVDPRSHHGRQDVLHGVDRHRILAKLRPTLR